MSKFKAGDNLRFTQEFTQKGSRFYEVGDVVGCTAVDGMFVYIIGDRDRWNCNWFELADSKQSPAEVRITDPVTGGQKGQKLAQLGALDPASLMRVAEVAGFGSKKYERYNFAKGYAWSLSYDAMQRHLHAFWGGEDLDEESGLPHLASAAWHALTLITFLERGRGTDDRFPS